MAQINLLPWREEHRREKKKEFLIQLAIVCILGVLASYVWIQSVEASLRSQSSRNNIIQSEISVLEKQVTEIKNLKKERKQLLDRMKVIQDLEGKRAIIVHYFDEFANAVPDGIYVTSFKRVGDMLFVEGVSESNNRVAAFMRKLDESEWFSEPNLKSVEVARNLGDQTSVFAMQLKAVLPESEEEAKEREKQSKKKRKKKQKGKRRG
ncbi:MAG: pilus assembly protein PilN [Alteromonadaceae bacterium]|nr:MAG: pilus assembly protein PilN [Alteromonadaceae bacterium]